MAAVDVAHRNSKPLPTPRGDTYRTTRRAAPIRARKAPVQVDSDDDAASQAEIDEAEAAEPFTLVPHVAEQTLHAVHSAIFGLPFADLELVVSNSAAGKKEEIVYANSKVLKRACPALMKQINITGRAELDTMEGEQIASAVAKNKAAAAAAVSKRGAYGGRSSRLSLDDDESAHEIAGKHADEHEDEEYADSVAEQPKHHHDEEHLDHDDDGTHQDVDHFDDDDLDQDSPIASRGKVAGAAPPAPAPIEIASPPPFSRSSSRFSKLMKFVTKDRLSPSSEEAAPFTPIGNASATDYSSRDDNLGTIGRGRVRRYSAGNDLTSAAGAANARASTASRVLVTGCSAATLQALVFYLYTGHATFASRLPPSRRYRDTSSNASFVSNDSERSDDDVASIQEARVTKSVSFPPVFSATAAYCVGRQLGLRDLATKAFDHICLELSPKTVLADLLSPFVDRFDEVQRAHLEYVSENWDRVKRRPDFEHTVGRLVNGDYPKANKALLKLFSKLSVAGGK